MEDDREHEAASCIRGYGEDHPSVSDTSRHKSNILVLYRAQKQGNAARSRSYRTKFYCLRNYFDFLFFVVSANDEKKFDIEKGSNYGNR